MNRHALSLSVVASAALLAASAGCSSSSSTNGGTSSSTSDGGAADGATSTGGGDLGSGKFGIVTAYSDTFASGTSKVTEAVVTASFTDSTASTASGATCDKTVLGACVSYRCPATSAPPADAGHPEARSAGKISLAGTSQPVELSPSADGVYSPFSSTTSTLWSGGEDLTFAASGADVPAFQVKLRAPHQPTVTAPAIPGSSSTQPFTVDRTKDLVFAWQGETEGHVAVTLARNDAPTSSSSPYTIVTCVFDAAAGSGTVPATALGTISAGTQGSYLVAARASTAVTAGDYGVTVRADSFALAPDGARASGLATFQ